MSQDRLSALEGRLIRLTVFVTFLVGLVRFLWFEISPIIGPLLRH
jgi:hypothetical protein